MYTGSNMIYTFNPILIKVKTETVGKNESGKIHEQNAECGNGFTKYSNVIRTSES